MAENALELSYSGQEVQYADINGLGTTAGLADDHLLAELLRLVPYNGSQYAKAILPYGYRGQSSPATVQTSGSSNGSIIVNPFRAIVGSRNTVAASPTGLSTDSAALANWRDIRSGVFVGTASTTLFKTIALAANSSGNPRWDLVYATISPDSNGPAVNRRVKNATTGQIAVQSVEAYVNSPVTVAVVTGTPGATPALPTLPADGGGAFNIPLAYVAVANGFTTTTTIANSEIRSTTGNGISEFTDVKAGFKAKPCNGNNDGNSAFNSGGSFAWNPASVPTAAYPRPAPWLPADMVGGGVYLAQIDNTNASSANWSHANLGVIDSSIDWRGRFFKITGLQAGSGEKFATDPTATSSSPTIPNGAANNIYSASPTVSLGASMVADTQLGVGYSTVWMLASATLGYNVGIVVQQSTGNLLWVNAASGASDRFFFWIEVSAAFPNY
jgi:hypothetical protein